MARPVGRKRQYSNATSNAGSVTTLAAKRLRADRVQAHHLVSLGDGTLVLINLYNTRGVDQSPLLSFLAGPGRDVALGTVDYLSPEQLLDIRCTCKTLLPVANKAVARLAQQLFTPACGLRDYVYYRHCWQRAYEQTSDRFGYDRPRMNKSDAMRQYLLSRAEADALPARMQHSPVAATLLTVEDVLRAVAVKHGSIMEWHKGEPIRRARRRARLHNRELRNQQQQPSTLQLVWRATMHTLSSLRDRVGAIFS